MLKHCRWILFFPVLLLLAGCASTDEAKKAKPDGRKTEKSKAESSWEKFLAKQKDEEKRFHRMDSRQLDNFQVYPWREGERRSEKLYENRDKSVFTNGWW